MKTLFMCLLLLTQVVDYTWYRKGGPGETYHIRSVVGSLQYSRSGNVPRCVLVGDVEGVKRQLHLKLEQKVCTDAGLLLSDLER